MNIYRRSFTLALPRSPPFFPGVQFNSFPTDRRALLFKRLEQAILIHSNLELKRRTH